MSAFSERLKGVVASAEQTHGWLAARLNERIGSSVTSVTVGRWINGQYEPTLEQIGHLAALLGVDPGWLAFGENSSAPGPRGKVIDLPDDALETRDQVRAARNRRDPKAG